MASIKMPEAPPSIPCLFKKAWVGECGKPTDNGWCDEHDNKQCVSCGNKATHDCGETIGPVCGALLCSDCCHSPSGNGHVTKKAAREIWEQKRIEREATVASRTSKEQRVDSSGCPLNLFELLKGDEPAYQIRPGYFAQLKHGLMGFFPAIFVDDPKRIVVTFSRGLIAKVLETLPPREFLVGENLFYIVEKFGVAFANIEDKEQSVPYHYLTEDEFLQLTADCKKPFKWAPGLLSDDMNLEEFMDTIGAIAAKTS